MKELTKPDTEKSYDNVLSVRIFLKDKSINAQTVDFRKRF